MNDESRLLMRIWESISDYISTNDKQAAADGLVNSFVDSGSEVEELYDVDGECPYLDRALATAALNADEDDGTEGAEEEY